MKTFLIWLVLFSILLGTIGYLLMFKEEDKSSKLPTDTLVTKETQSFDEALVYTCDDGMIVATALTTNNSEVMELSLPNRDPVILKMINATPFSTYSDSQDLLVEINNDLLTVKQNGSQVYSNCKVGRPAIATEPAESVTLDKLSNSRWRWIDSVVGQDETLKPNAPEDFILTFAEASHFSLKTDCNNAGGSYLITESSSNLGFNEVVVTEMACEGDTKEAEFISQLRSVTDYNFGLDGNYLELTFENGRMNLVRVTE